jgi:hypothetical protein
MSWERDIRGQGTGIGGEIKNNGNFLVIKGTKWGKIATETQRHKGAERRSVSGNQDNRKCISVEQVNRKWKSGCIA